MNTRVSFVCGITIAAWALAVLLLFAAESPAAEYFDKNMGAGTFNDFDPLLGTPSYFETMPSGVSAADRYTVIRIVTKSPSNLTDSLKFKIVTPGDKTDPELTLSLSAKNAASYIEDSGNVVFANPVTAQIVDTPIVFTGYIMIKISIKYEESYTTNEHWELHAAKKPAARRYVGFHATDNGAAAVDALVTRPKLVFNPTATTPSSGVRNIEVDFGERLEDLLPTSGLIPTRSVEILNEGTGPLEINGVTQTPPSGGPFSALTISSMFDVIPMDKYEIQNITFRPTDLGEFEKNITFTVVNFSEVSQIEVDLKGTGTRLDAVLLFDISTSMDDTPGGGPTSDEKLSRLGYAKQAVIELHDVLEKLAPSGLFGLFIYPDPDVPCPSSKAEVGIGTNQNVLSVIWNKMQLVANGGLGTNNATPITAGLKLAKQKLDDELAGVPSIKKKYVKRAIFLFTDGEHNCWPSDPPTNQISSLQSKKIRVYTIPYGSSPYYLGILNQIATNTGGEQFGPNALDFNSLKAAFKEALQTWLNLEPIADPEGTIARNQDISHEVCVEEEACSLTFLLDWDIWQDDAITFSLETPEGHVINRTVAQGSSDVSYIDDETYAGYVVTGAYLRDGDGVGLWTLNLRGSADLPQGQTIEYSYSVLADSYLKTSSSLQLDHIFTGDRHLMQVNLAEGGVALQNAEVWVSTNQPDQSFSNYFATAQVEPSLVFEAPDIIQGEPASLVQRKLYALENFAKQPFRDSRRVNSVQLFDDGTHGDKTAGDGVYSNYAALAHYEGTYEYNIAVNGLTMRKNCFERDILVTRYVATRLTAEGIHDQVNYADFEVSPFFPPELVDVLNRPVPDGFVRKNVVVTPRDELGNYWGPGHAEQIKFAVENGTLIGDVVADTLDGSYVGVIEYKEGDNPSVAVTARGISAAPKSMLEEPPEEPRLKYFEPYAGWFILDEDLAEDNLIIGVRGGFGLTSRLHLEAEIGSTVTDELVDDSGTVFIASANLLFDILNRDTSSFVPFLTVGSGIMNVQTPEGTDESLASNFGAGVTLRLAEKTHLRFEARDYVRFAEEESDEEDGGTTQNLQFSVGVMIPF